MPAAARLPEVSSGAEEPGEGCVRAVLSRSAAKIPSEIRGLGSVRDAVPAEGLHARSGSGGFVCPADFHGEGDPHGGGVRVVVF